MTRINEGKFTITKSYEAIDDIVNQALTLVQYINTTGRLQVSVPDEIILVPVDGKLIVQVIVNLLDNAFKYAGDEVKVLLNVYVKDNNAIFEVSDNGKGINPLIFDSIFDGFVSYHKNDIVDGSMGVGIGLTICKEIVNAHKGTITAGNLEQGGAKFTVVLPLEVNQ